MASVRVVAALLSGVCLCACSLPTPDYKVIQYPAPYRKEADGAVLDNEDMRLDAEGYRLDQNGQRIGEVDARRYRADQAAVVVPGAMVYPEPSYVPPAPPPPPAGVQAFRDEYGFRYDGQGNRLDARGNIISPQSTQP